jgi:hypothetical protein
MIQTILIQIGYHAVLRTNEIEEWAIGVLDQSVNRGQAVSSANAERAARLQSKRIPQGRR